MPQPCSKCSCKRQQRRALKRACSPRQRPSLCLTSLIWRVTHVRRRYEAAGVIDTQRGQEAIDDLTAWPVTRYPHDLFLGRIWALRHNLTAYDADYVALAEALDVTLVTCDARLAASVGHRATIELV